MGFPFQIIQGGNDFMLVAYEFAGATRTIRMNWKQDSPSDFWMGWSRGHWEGDTLVVDTTNLRGAFRASSDRLRLVERFTRIDMETLLYEFTVDDPDTWTKPWTAQVPMSKSKEPIFEYACHEVNYSMTNVLAGARAQEKAIGTARGPGRPRTD